MENKFIAHQRDFDKKSQSLQSHLTGVSKLSKEHASKMGLEIGGELIGLLHDLGKYSQKFQDYLNSAVGNIDPDADEYTNAKAMKGKIDHSSAGAQLVWQILSKRGQVEHCVAQVLALCIASHHSGLIDNLTSNKKSTGEDSFSKRMVKKDDKTYLQEALTNIDESIEKHYLELINNPLLISSFQDVLTTIGKSQSINSSLFHFHSGLLIRFLFSCLIDADRQDSADFESPETAKQRQNNQYKSFSQLRERLEHRLSGFKIDSEVNKIRHQISCECLQAAERDQGIFTLSVPTGGGKTLASLRFALRHAEKHKLDRVIYIVPFTSIIDQNAQDARKTLEDSDGDIVLEHHSNLTPENQTYYNKILSENWDAPVIYTTLVQFLESLFSSGTRGTRRMHQLAHSVIIFDEIQTLPINCTHLFCNAINFLINSCKSSVVLCTATQPLLNEVDPQKGTLAFTQDNEIVSDTKKLFKDLKRVEIINKTKPGGWSFDAIAELAIEEIEDSTSCLVIVNTKNAAHNIYQYCRDNSSYKVMHLSTNMCPVHRKEILKELRDTLDEDTPLICVSTQLIEAGVDVDFGAVIRFTAGLDSIAQAAGRCNRNGKRLLGKVYVVNPANENLDMLPSIKTGKENTERILIEFEANPEHFDNDIIGPKAMRQYFQYYFFDRKHEMDYPLTTKDIGHDDNLISLLAQNEKAVGEFIRINENHPPEIFFKQAFMSAAKAFKTIDTPTQGIVVPYGDRGKELITDLCAVSDITEQIKLLREAQQYTVNVYPYLLDKLKEMEAVHPVQPEEMEVLYLRTEYYDKEFGLSEEPTGEMESYCV